MNERTISRLIGRLLAACLCVDAVLRAETKQGNQIHAMMLVAYEY